MIDFLAQIWSSAARRALTYFLATASLAMGVAAFVCLSAFSQSYIKGSMRRALEEAAWDIPPDAGPTISIEVALDKGARGRRLDTEWVDSRVRQVMGKNVAAMASFMSSLKIGRHAIARTRGRAASSCWVRLNSSAFGIVGHPTAGRLFRPEDDRSGEDLCIIGQTLADGFESDKGVVGRTLKVNGRQFRIVGVVNAPRTYDLLLISFTAAGRSLFRVRPPGRVEFTVKSDETHLGSEVDRVWSAIAQALGPDYSVSVSSAWLESEGERHRLAYVRIFLGLLSMLPLAVGLLGMVSMLLANLNSRVHEIGLHRALGATRLRQAVLILFEAGLTGLLASVVGIPFGMLVLHVLTSAWGSELRATPGWIAVALLPGAITAVLAGLIPARAAMKVSPAEALRAE